MTLLLALTLILTVMTVLEGTRRHLACLRLDADLRRLSDGPSPHRASSR
jgi:hypothetical protein